VALTATLGTLGRPLMSVVHTTATLLTQSMVSTQKVALPVQPSAGTNVYVPAVWFQLVMVPAVGGLSAGGAAVVMLTGQLGLSAVSSSRLPGGV
jgi:hypothetical protein